MKITLVVLFLTGLTIYSKCVVVLSLPPSVIPHASILDKSGKSLKPFTAIDNESQQRLLVTEEEEMNEPILTADLYLSLKDFLPNEPSFNLKKRENSDTFDMEDIAAIQQEQAKATLMKTNQNQISSQPNDSNNDGLKHFNYNKNKKNENNILKSTKAFYLPLPRSNSATDENEATNFNLNTQPLLRFPLQKLTAPEVYDDTSEWLSSNPDMINDIFGLPTNGKQEPLHLKRRDVENIPLVAGTVATEDSPSLNRFIKPMKYLSTQCPLENGNNCLQDYYGDIIAGRNNALLKQQQNRDNNPFAGFETSTLNYNNDINEDDIVLLLTAEQKLMQFLGWALSELYSNGKLSNNTAREEDTYLPGMYKGKKFNLSGRIEPPLLVEEPHYVLVRREYAQDEDNDENNYKRGLNYGGDPFIPPRGRKHNLPDLDSLLQRYETFVPNRGRRDKIKDIFKHDDLFYPNRGKRQMTTAANDYGDIDEISNSIDIDDNKINQHYYNNEQNAERHKMPHPLLSNKLMKYNIENLMAKMKRKLHQPGQKLANISATLQQTLPLLEKRLKSVINILQSHKKLHQQHVQKHYNARHQWRKRHMSAKASSTQPVNSNDRQMPAIRLPTMGTNSLQTTLRSMPSLQQLTQLFQHQQQSDLSPPHLRLDNKFLWQQQQKSLKSLAQQFDPLSWHKLQLPLQQQLQKYLQRHNQPILTMRHPRLTALQHSPAMQQKPQYLAAP